MHVISQIILAIVIVWFLSFILTITDVFPTSPDHYGYGARTDLNPEAIQKAAWFYFPYPGKHELAQSYFLTLAITIGFPAHFRHLFIHFHQFLIQFRPEKFIAFKS